MAIYLLPEDQLTETASGPRQPALDRARVKPGKSAPTIYDIARLAGVNPSTVSRALTKPGRVSAKTQKRIEDAAAQLNYRVNVFARALPTGRTHTVALIVSDITNPAYFEVIRGAEGAASEHDYTLLLAESAESAQTELRTAQRLMATVDGLILASPRLSDEDIMQLATQKPVAVINRQVEGVHSVFADPDAGVTDAVRHLAALGHHSLAFLAGPERSWMSGRRWESIRTRCQWASLAVTSIPSGLPTVDGGRRGAAAVRASGATAVFCYNDLMAIGLMQELQFAGVRIPDELSILGFDNIFGSDFTTPPLSTIRSPLRTSGASALRRILDELDATAVEDETGEIATELVLRGSTGKAP
jgi:DNA-binding LacI/PurR family transcriptional regulator